MKHLKLLILFFAACVCSTVSAQKKGDVNVDGYIDISDVVSTINVIAGIETFKLNSDINTDKKTDISDIVAIINLISKTKQDEELDAAVKAGLCPDNHHPHAIDLGDGIKWACCNVGASAPWEYGGYYAWGEMEEKEHYDLTNYKYCSLEFGDHGNWIWVSLGQDIAGTDFDIAHVKWGYNWRMPNVEQFEALINNCSKEAMKLNEVQGRKIIAENGNAIFLPSAGSKGVNLKGADIYDHGHYCSFFTSNLCPLNPTYMYQPTISFGITIRGDEIFFPNNMKRESGLSIRPISE